VTVENLDALLPPEMARKAEDVGVRKATTPLGQLVMLGLLAGAFIALGATFASVAVTDPDGRLPWGVGRVLGGLVFSTGLVAVVVGGAELFTGNALLVMAWASGRVSAPQVLRSWVVVYLANAVGAVATAVLVWLAGTWKLAGGAVGATMIAQAQAKCALDPLQAFAAGVLANALVCLAVWLSFSARSTVDRVVAVMLPVAAFVASGFEHSIANLYVVPLGMLLQGADGPLTPWAFLVGNLLPVTAGNVVGGSVLVGGVYWAVYLRRPPTAGHRRPPPSSPGP
jgi:formate/nitrite transporter